MDYDRFKLFVGGIGKETSEEDLKQYFSRYGLVLGAVVAKDKVTGISRGFGFVRFANDYDVVKALSGTHFILGKPVDVRKAFRKHELYQHPFSMQVFEGKVQQTNGGLREMASNGNIHRTKKIFVGGLSSNTTQEEFKSYFERFGRTIDVVVMHDGVTNKPRGFGFVTYDSEDSVEFVMQSNFHELSDKRVEVKRAIPKEGIQSNNGNVNVNVPPTYSSFQATPYVPEQNGYGMVLQYPPVFGYHHSVQAVQYPYGYQFTAQVPNVSWNNPIMQPTGFYCAAAPPPPPPSNTLGYSPYMNGFDLSGTSIPRYNPVPWPATGDAAGVLIQFGALKFDVHSQAHQRMNGGNMGIPLQNGTYR